MTRPPDFIGGELRLSGSRQKRKERDILFLVWEEKTTQAKKRKKKRKKKKRIDDHLANEEGKSQTQH